MTTNLSAFSVIFPPISTYTVTIVGGEAKISMNVKRLNKLTVTGNLTITPVNFPESGVVGITILDIYNGGSYTITFDANFEFAGAVQPILTENAWDRLILVTYDATKVWLHLVDNNFII